ncbi:hypothetical protein KUTeg_021672 [Tegillarca granosa]|uniref:Discoidin domain-containing protein n=1 Tax=Tegillarca granosa TaxID=220873 RepID=A0ABQ9E407_TEGGR|nr:hypothetical protein KUTeg_021672 [Tegillarca granosa]
MPEGHQRGIDVELDDFTYDGIRKDKYLSKGMGQLMDGVIGEDHFSKDIRVFKEAKVYFSIGGRYYLSKPVDYPFLRDSWMEHARYVKIPLKNNVGRYVKVKLVFDAKWIMVSEVTFESNSSPRDYAVPDVTKSALIVALPPQPPTRVTPTSKQSTPGVMMNSLDKPPTYDALYAAADVINVQVPNIPSFQGVHLCECVRVGEYMKEDTYNSRTGNRPVLVAVKMLRRNADDRASLTI